MAALRFSASFRPLAALVQERQRLCRYSGGLALLGPNEVRGRLAAQPGHSFSSGPAWMRSYGPDEKSPRVAGSVIAGAGLSGLGESTEERNAGHARRKNFAGRLTGGLRGQWENLGAVAVRHACGLHVDTTSDFSL